MGKKLKYFVLGALCLLGLVTAGNSGQPVKADDAATTQEVVLTKFGFAAGPEHKVIDKSTDKTPADVRADWAKGAKALSGVEFKVYDITTKFWEIAGRDNVLAGASEDAEEKLFAEASENLSAPVAEGVTDTKGEIHFNLAKTSGTKRAVYLFKETKGVPGYNGSANFVLDMGAPVAGDQKLYVYPKNETVETNFHKFVKINSETKKPLAKAEFKITNGKGEYAALTDIKTKTHLNKVTGFIDATVRNYDITWGSENDATTFVSGADGLFGLGGMTDSTSDYKVIETNAPTGYEKATDEKELTFKFDKKTSEINDKPTAFLPHTGGAGIVGIIAAGLVLILATVFGIRKRQAQA